MAEENKVRRAPTAEEISSFCSQIAMMLDAGVPLYDGLDMLAQTTENEQQGNDLYRQVSDRVNMSGSLHEALEQDNRWPRYLVEMTAIGEETGHLDKVMHGLASHYDREDKIRNALSHAMTYPIVLGSLLMVVVFIMLWKILPMFKRVLNSMGAGSTQSGRSIMQLGSVIGWVVLILFGVLLAGLIVCLILLKTKHRAKLISFFRRHVPVLNRLTSELSAARVSSVLSMTVGSGYPMEQALEMSRMILEDPVAEKKLEGAAQQMENGSTMSEALAESGLYEPLHGRMLRVAAASGQEETTLAHLSGLYEEKAEEDIGHLLSIVEPTLVAVLSVVIGAILLSVMLPMAGILTSML